MKRIELRTEPLSRVEFAPFGDVIEIEGARHFPINAGGIERFDDLARVELAADGQALISIAVCNHAASLPYRLPCVERHPLGSQAFIPMDETPMVVVVGPPGEFPAPDRLRAFVSNGRQGINYHRGTWHMPLIGLVEGQRFLLVDRGGPGANCEERAMDSVEVVVCRGDGPAR